MGSSHNASRKFLFTTLITTFVPTLVTISFHNASHTQALTKAPDGELLTQALVAVPLSYMCLCAYYSLFKLGMFSFYQLVPRSSGGPSMLRSGSLLCRFAPPLCFNLLHVIRMDNPPPENVRTGLLCAS